MNLTFLDEAGKPRIMEMGCYGIGVSRIVAAAIEQNHDGRGIIFPTAMAPFAVAIVPIAMRKSDQTRQAAEQLYDELGAQGVEVFLDDRDERPGIMFADTELLGIPHRLVVGERGLKAGNVEYQGRRDTQSVAVPLTQAVEFIKTKLCAA
jgi:prolyl-tRNA synthetase